MFLVIAHIELESCQFDSFVLTSISIYYFVNKVYYKKKGMHKKKITIFIYAQKRDIYIHQECITNISTV